MDKVVVNLINIRLEVRLEQETVWLTQQQIADLFGVKQSSVSKHLSNIFKEGELQKDSVYSILEYTASDGKVYKTAFYNLDAILSVGYMVNRQLIQMEDRIDLRLEAQHDGIRHIKEIQAKQQSRIDFFVRISLPPVKGMFLDGALLLSLVVRIFLV